MARFDPQQSYLLQPRPRRWKFNLVLGLVVLGIALAGVAWVELAESFLQAGYFAERAKASTWTVEPGADKDIWLPSAGPYEQRLGYAQLNTCLPRLAGAGYTIAAQARQSQGFRDIVGRGHFPIYREKSRAGLSILDRHGRGLYDIQ